MRDEPGSIAFYWSTLILAGVWVVGAIAAGPLHHGGGSGTARVASVRSSPRSSSVWYWSLPLVVLVTAVKRHREELFFRGALYAAVTSHPVAVTSFASALVVLAAGNPMLTLAAVLLAVVVGLKRRASGGILGPIHTHVTWSGSMLFALPLLFGCVTPSAGPPRAPGALSRSMAQNFVGTSWWIESSVTTTSVLIESMRFRPVLTSMSATRASQ